MSADLVNRMNHLIALDDPKYGGPYGGAAAQQFIETMEKAAARIEKLEAALKIERKAKDQLRFDIQAALNRSIG